MMTDLMLMLTPVNLIMFLLVIGRLSGMMITAPFFSTIQAPTQTKAVLVFMVAFIMYPMVAAATPDFVSSHVIDMPVLMVLMLKEVLIGAVIGFCANIIFIGVQMAGQILSMQMGLSISNILDPVTQQNVPVLGQFYMFLASLTFIFINGHLWLFSGIYNSYKTVPINYDFIFTGPFVEKIIYFTSQMFNVAFEIIVPIYAVLIIIALVLGLMSKALPQMNVFMVALPLKIYIGIALIALFLKPATSYLIGFMESLIMTIDKLFI